MSQGSSELGIVSQGSSESRDARVASLGEARVVRHVSQVSQGSEALKPPVSLVGSHVSMARMDHVKR